MVKKRNGERRKKEQIREQAIPTRDAWCAKRITYEETEQN